MTVAVLMPVFDEGGALLDTLSSLAARSEDLGGVAVYMVDDGSALAIDGEEMRRKIGGAPAFSFVLARHVVNLGQGAALETARQLALDGRDADVFVTMDADGQHRVEDIFPLVAAIRAGADVAFGNRFLGESNVPFSRRVVLAFARMFERAVTGLALSDAHNGFRALSRRALEAAVLKQNRMAHATEIKQRLSRAPLSIVEVPVSVRYSPASLAKGQSALGAFAILRDLFHRYLFEEP